jgi:hypothetical protein
MKGERYIDGANRCLVDLASCFAYADMSAALATYDDLRPTMRLKDVALLGCLDRFFWTCLEKVERHLLSLTPVFRTGLG